MIYTVSKSISQEITNTPCVNPKNAQVISHFLLPEFGSIFNLWPEMRLRPFPRNWIFYLCNSRGRPLIIQGEGWCFQEHRSVLEFPRKKMKPSIFVEKDSSRPKIAKNSLKP